MKEKFNTIFCKIQLVSIKCVVRHIYPSVVKELHKSDVKEILPLQRLNIALSFCFSLAYILHKSALTVFLDIS
jgi:hypothetical protein